VNPPCLNVQWSVALHLRLLAANAHTHTHSLTHSHTHTHKHAHVHTHSHTRSPTHAYSQVFAWIEGFFYFSMVWSIGGTANLASQKHFDMVLRMMSTDAIEDKVARDWIIVSKVLAPEDPCRVPFPDAGEEGHTVYDYKFVPEGNGRWAPWSEFIDNTEFASDAELSSITVPTTDTVRYSYLLDVLVKHGR
jgi:dynein heavy chain